MLVNDIYDLRGITACLYGAYALSQNIDASPTKKWNYLNGHYQGFYPIMNFSDKAPFSGTFDGNNYEINGLFIYRPDEPNVGLFGDATGVNSYKCTIKNFSLVNSSITGKRCVGVVVGQATGVSFDTIKVANNKVRSIFADEKIEDGIVGEIAGCVLDNNHKNLTKENDSIVTNDEKRLFGSCVRCNSSVDKKETKKNTKGK